MLAGWSQYNIVVHPVNKYKDGDSGSQPNRYTSNQMPAQGFEVTHKAQLSRLVGTVFVAYTLKKIFSIGSCYSQGYILVCKGKDLKALSSRHLLYVSRAF